MNRLLRRICRMSIAVAAALAVSGCATTMSGPGDPTDPWEPVNRATYALNDALDQAVMKPAAKLYLKLPDSLRNGIHNVFDNAAYPGTVVNQLLQGKFELEMEDSMRFVFNSTLGIGGWLDLATGFGLERHEEDFGQTLAVWGMKEGSFINYPLFGPSSIRDTPGIVAGMLTDVLTYVAIFPVSLLKFVDTRANLDGAIRLRDESALDPYIFTRDAYRQRRNFLVHDGNPPLDDFDDFEEDEEEEED